MIEAKHLTKRYGKTVGGRRGLLHREARAGDRLPRPQRGRQVDHHAHDPGPGHADLW